MCHTIDLNTLSISLQNLSRIWFSIIHHDTIPPHMTTANHFWPTQLWLSAHGGFISFGENLIWCTRQLTNISALCLHIELKCLGLIARAVQDYIPQSAHATDVTMMDGSFAHWDNFMQFHSALDGRYFKRIELAGLCKDLLLPDVEQFDWWLHMF